MAFYPSGSKHESPYHDPHMKQAYSPLRNSAFTVPSIIHLARSLNSLAFLLNNYNFHVTMPYYSIKNFTSL